MKNFNAVVLVKKKKNPANFSQYTGLPHLYLCLDVHERPTRTKSASRIHGKHEHMRSVTDLKISFNKISHHQPPRVHTHKTDANKSGKGKLNTNNEKSTACTLKTDSRPYMGPGLITIVLQLKSAVFTLLNEERQRRLRMQPRLQN